VKNIGALEDRYGNRLSFVDFLIGEMIRNVLMTMTFPRFMLLLCVHTYISCCRLKGRIDSQLAVQFEKKYLYWKLMSRPVVENVKLLASLGLPQRT
jgi:hypothetical protein